MKSFRKVFTAAMMVVLSFAMLSTASFAWFAMNSSVTATNMNITAQTKSAYLQIKQGGLDAATEYGASAEAPMDSEAGTLNLTTEPKFFSVADIVQFKTEKLEEGQHIGEDYYALKDGVLTKGSVKVAAGTSLENMFLEPSLNQAHPDAGKYVTLTSGESATYWLATGKIADETLVYTKYVVESATEIASGEKIYIPLGAREITMGAKQGKVSYKKSQLNTSFFEEVVGEESPKTPTDTTSTTATTYTQVKKVTGSGGSLPFKLGTYEQAENLYGITSGSAVGTAAKNPVAEDERADLWVKATDSVFVKLPTQVAETSLESIAREPLWATAESTKSSEDQGGAGGQGEAATTYLVDPAHYDDYRLANTFTIKMGGREQVKLTLNDVSVETDNLINDNIHDAIRVLVVATQITTKGAKTAVKTIYDAGTGTYAAATDTENAEPQTLCDTMASTDVVEVDIYIYYDGTDVSAFSDNMLLDFVGYNVNVDFASVDLP